MSLLDRSTSNPVDSPERGYKAQARLMKSCSWPTAARPMWNTAQLAASRIGAATRMSLRSMVAGERCLVILRNGAGPSRRQMGIDRFRCTGFWTVIRSFPEMPILPLSLHAACPDQAPEAPQCCPPSRAAWAMASCR